MLTVYAWPPVEAVGTEWTVVAPINESRSIVTGARFASSAQRARRAATVVVTAIGGDSAGAGYMELLKQMLDGGIHAVRLYSFPINWHLDWIDQGTFGRSPKIPWTSGGNPSRWTNHDRLFDWFDGPVLFATPATDGIWPAIRIEGLPPHRIIARPADFLTLFVSATETVQVQALTVSRSDADGVAIVRLVKAPPAFGRVRVELGGADTAVFFAESLPRAVQPANSDWTYTWRFIETFYDEHGGFREIDPWR